MVSSSAREHLLSQVDAGVLGDATVVINTPGSSQVNSNDLLATASNTPKQAREIAAFLLLFIVALVVFHELLLLYFEKRRNALDDGEVELYERIHSIKRDLRLFEGPSNFHIGAKLKRKLYKLEQERDQKREKAFSTTSFFRIPFVPISLQSKAIRVLLPLPLVFYFWGEPLSPMPTNCVGPFFSFPDAPRGTLSIYAFYWMTRLIIDTILKETWKNKEL
eukprot:g4946.t1